MKRRMRSSTGYANISWSRPTSTFRRSMRPLPTWRRCFAHFTHKDVLLDTLRKTGGRLFDLQLKPEVQIDNDVGCAHHSGTTSRCESPDRARATIRRGFRHALGAAQRAGDASEFRTTSRPRPSRMIADRCWLRPFSTPISPSTRAGPLISFVSSAPAAVRSTNGDLPVPLAERLAAEASRTAEQFFVICARALDYCPPVDITFGDFLRAVSDRRSGYASRRSRRRARCVHGGISAARDRRGRGGFVFGGVAVLAEGPARQAARSKGWYSAIQTG